MNLILLWLFRACPILCRIMCSCRCLRNRLFARCTGFRIVTCWSGFHLVIHRLNRYYLRSFLSFQNRLNTSMSFSNYFILMQNDCIWLKSSKKPSHSFMKISILYTKSKPMVQASQNNSLRLVLQRIYLNINSFFYI